jgi:hypothetical protein
MSVDTISTYYSDHLILSVSIPLTGLQQKNTYVLFSEHWLIDKNVCYTDMCSGWYTFVSSAYSVIFILFTIVLSVLWFMASGYPIDILDLYLDL